MSDKVMPFEPRRFRTAAAHYLDGRPAYAERLIQLVVRHCGLRPEHRVLDLGCGPGQLAKAFAPFAATVTGIDPEAEMLRLARQDAPANVTFIEGSSYHLGDDLAGVRLVTMGRSFHWMDRAATLRRLDRLVAPGGSIALCHDHHPDVPENAWQKPFREVLKRYAGGGAPWRGPDWLPHISILLNSAFCEIDEISVIEIRPLNPETLVDRALSMSTTGREKLGERADQMEAELIQLSATLLEAGQTTEVVATKALIARRA
jgi:SAM-dependent methyltransferase